MSIVHTIAEAQRLVSEARRHGKTVGLVPTMGALHEGHMALVSRARQDCDFVAVSVFVNPSQFAPTEDLAKYPRTLEQDAQKCDAMGADMIFAPIAQEIYPDGFDSWVDVGGVSEILEGELRPTHFRGVSTVCLKLFNIFQAERAYFGLKDYQQLCVIKKMVTDLNLPIEIVPVDIVREHNGLAMSSRNRYLSPDERRAALILSRAIADGQMAFQSGERSASAVELIVRARLQSELLSKIDYAVVVDAETLLPIHSIKRPAVILLAVRIGSTRLIDNAILKP